MGMTETASRIIGRWGQAGVFERPGVPTGGAYGSQAPATLHNATVAVLAYEQEHHDGTLIRADDLRVIVSVEGLDITPTVADRLTVGSRQFSIVRVTPLAPDGSPRFYDVQVRR